MSIPPVTRGFAAALCVLALSLAVASCSWSGDGDGGSSDGHGTTGATGVTGTTGSGTAVAATGETGAAGSETPAADTGTTAASGVISSDPFASGRFFSADSPWNTRVDGLPVDDDSARMLSLATKRRAVREVAGRRGVETIVRRVDKGVFINTEAWAPLIVAANAPGSRQTRFVCRQSKCGAGPPTVPATIPIPADTTPDPRYDGWLSVIDREHGLGYDFWRARRQTADMISYQYAKAWTLDGPGFSRPVEVDPGRAVGARGSGLPLFAGVIAPSEAAGRGIDHALSISVPGLARRNFVQPASVTDGVGSQKSLPAGARIRLKPDVGADRLARRAGVPLGQKRLRGERRVTVEAILQALREYGAIVVDRAAVPTLYAPRGTSRRAIRGGELDWLELSDFEVIQLPRVYKDPPLSKVNLEGPTTGEEMSR